MNKQAGEWIIIRLVGYKIGMGDFYRLVGKLINKKYKIRVRDGKLRMRDRKNKKNRENSKK